MGLPRPPASLRHRKAISYLAPFGSLKTRALLPESEGTNLNSASFRSSSSSRTSFLSLGRKVPKSAGISGGVFGGSAASHSVGSPGNHGFDAPSTTMTPVIITEAGLSSAPAMFQPMSGFAGSFRVATAFWMPLSKTCSVAFRPLTVTKALVMYLAFTGTSKSAMAGRVSSPK